MTPTQQNEAIAKWMGVHYHKPTEDEVKSGSYYQYEPDYVNDLNAMHDVEAKFTREQFIDYVDSWLCCAVADKPGNVCSDDTGWAPAMVHANAAIKAECLLRTLNLWTD